MDQDKLKLLRSLRLLDQIPEERLATLEPFLKPVALKDGDVLFDEGGKGESLYFISAGQIKISKKISGEDFKDLAILGAGDCLGEMAAIDVLPRSARASALGEAALLELHRDDLNAWLKANPSLAMGFFSGLVPVLSKRLRRTSTEITMLFDLSNLFLEPCPNGKALLGKVLAHVVPHLPGAWSATASLYNMFNEEMEPAGGQGAKDFSSLASKLPAHSETRSLWLDDASYYVSLPGPKRPYGYLLFHCHDALVGEERTELGRALATVARLLTSALENINYRNEDALRARLGKAAEKTYGPSI